MFTLDVTLWMWVFEWKFIVTGPPFRVDELVFEWWWLHLATYVSCSVSINERLNAVSHVSVWDDFLSYFPNFLRLYNSVGMETSLKLYFSGLCVWWLHRTYLQVICSMYKMLFWRRLISILSMTNLRANQDFRSCIIWNISSCRLLLPS